MTRKSLLLAVVSSIFFLSVLNSNADVRVSAFSELSGSFATFGEDCRKGYVIAQKYLTPENAKIEVLYADHKRDGKTGISEFNRHTLIENSIGIASSATPVVMAFAPLSTQRKIPVMAVSAHPRLLDNPYMYRFWFNSEKEGRAIAEKSIEKSFKKVAVITIQDEYPMAVSRVFTGRIGELGGKVVVNEEVLKSETDYSSIIAKVIATDHDALFLNFIGDSLGVFIKKLKELKYNKQIFSTFSASKKEVIENAGGMQAVEGIIFLEVDSNKPLFIEKMKKEFGVDHVLGFQYACYSAMGALLNAFRVDSGIENSQDLINVVTATNEVQLLDEILPIVNREAQLGMVFKVMRNGKIVSL